VRALLVILFLVGFVVTYWWLILLILAAIGVGLALWLGHQRQLEAAGRRQREHAALGARADQQHAWILAGDDRGIYGEYGTKANRLSWFNPSIAHFETSQLSARFLASSPTPDELGDHGKPDRPRPRLNS
jgi:hypothetical protein